jgi:hypothetical protein
MVGVGLSKKISSPGSTGTLLLTTKRPLVGRNRDTMQNVEGVVKNRSGISPVLSSDPWNQ